ncbi:MAG: hypothetical protein V7K98_27780 [Nostoc sp.]|uniref:hypothetical protein n=1 Tax=Nostoc sp. TaxID=1180 RepID=UPI002FF52DA8
MPNTQCPMPNTQCPMPNTQCPMPNAQCPMPNTNTRGECASLVLWFRVELAIKLNKTANGV